MVKEIQAAIDHGLSAEPSKLVVTVLFTTAKSTSTALEVAARLAQGFDTSIEVVAPYVVPFPDPVDHPPVDTGFLLRRLCEVAEGVPVQTTVHLILGRNLEQSLLSALRPNSIVVIGEREPLWPGLYRRLAESLRARGHQVIFTGHRNGKHA
jgi:hypothetical protein